MLSYIRDHRFQAETSLFWTIGENEVPDEAVFASLDPQWPGLEKVIEAYNADDLERAKRELIQYFYTRRSPKWFFDYRGQVNTPIDLDKHRYIWGNAQGSSSQVLANIIRDVDQLTQHRFQGGLLYNLGKNWDQYPLYDLNQTDDKPLRVTANRFVRMNFLNSLTIAYHHTQDQRYKDTFTAMVKTIVEGYLEKHPYIPDPVKSKEDYSLQFSRTPFRNNMSVARSVLNMINIMYTELFYDDFIPVDHSFRLFRFIWYVMLHHRSFDSNHYRHHNHHLFERGIVPLFIGMMFPEFPILRPLYERGEQVIKEHLQHDFHPSGGYDEHSLGYSVNTTLTEFLLPVKVLIEHNDIPGFEKWDEKLNLTYSFYSGLVLPDGTFPDIGDDGGGPAQRFLTQGIEYYHNKTAQAVLHALDLSSGEDVDAEWNEMDIPLEQLPPLTLNDPHSGFFCSRENWTKTSNCMVFVNKKMTQPCSHNHVDMLSLILAVQGETLIGEPQASILYKYVSNRSALDDYMRGLGSHNSVMVNGAPLTKRSLRSAGRMNAWTVDTEQVEESEERVYVRASHHAYKHAQHTREILFVREQGWWIRDSILLDGDSEILETGRPSPHIQRWHLEHGVEVEMIGNNALVLHGEKSQLLCVWPEGVGSIKLWRNEAVLDIAALKRYKTASELPLIVDVAFSAQQQSGVDRIECIFLNVTAESAPLQATVERCRKRFSRNTVLRDNVNLL